MRGFGGGFDQAGIGFGELGFEAIAGIAVPGGARA